MHGSKDDAKDSLKDVVWSNRFFVILRLLDDDASEVKECGKAAESDELAHSEGDARLEVLFDCQVV